MTVDTGLIDEVAIKFDTIDNKSNLGQEKILDETWKKENLDLIKSRMSGWQLNTFIESYNHKVHSGISLFKKNLLKK